MMCLRKLLILAVVFCLAGSAAADERYFVLVFGTQRPSPNPNYAHTFAAFVRVCENGAGPTVDYHVISWLPDNGQVRVQRLFAEKGRNFELHETIHWAYRNGERVSVWGPYEIEGVLYRRSVRNWKWLQTGFVRYKATDSFRLDFRVTNCIHAVSTLVGLRPMRVPSPGWGETASWNVALRYHVWIKNWGRTHDWLIPALGLDQYPLIYRNMRRPRTGLIWTRIKQRLGLPLDNSASWRELQVFPDGCAFSGQLTRTDRLGKN